MYCAVTDCKGQKQDKQCTYNVKLRHIRVTMPAALQPTLVFMQNAPTYLPNFTQISCFLTHFRHRPPISNFTQTRPVGAALMLVDGWKDVKKICDRFCKGFVKVICASRTSIYFARNNDCYKTCASKLKHAIRDWKKKERNLKRMV